MLRLTGLMTALLLAWGRFAGAQEADSNFVERGPRFLLASAAAPEPVRVDVARTPVLRQSIYLDLNGVALGDALREIAAKAGLQLAFSTTMLPAERTITFHADRITVAAALTELLIDAQVDVLFSRDGRAVLVRRAEPFQGGTVSGRVTDAKSGKAVPNVSVFLEGTRWRTTTAEYGTYRLLEVTPGTYTLVASRIGYSKESQSVVVGAGQELTVDLALQVAATELEQVVVNGTVAPTERKAVPTPITVITADQIERENVQRVDELFRGDIPGALAWDKGPYHYQNNIVVRGASNLTGANFIKTYIDGVEVASPLFLSGLDLSTIERIEVIRGPEASTVYGAEALNGVMLIFTKKGRASAQPSVDAKATIGVRDTKYVSQSRVFEQDHSVSVSDGVEGFSYHLSGAYRYDGDWLREYYDKTLSLSGGMQGSRGPLSVSVSGRYSIIKAGVPEVPAQQGTYPTAFPSPLNSMDRFPNSTFGGQLAYRATPWWVHQLTLGSDNTSSDYITAPRHTTSADTLFIISSGRLSKTSVGYHTTLSTPVGARLQSSLTLGADYYAYDESLLGVTSTTSDPTTIPTGQPSDAEHTRYHNTGYFAQTQVSLSDALFVTAGLRSETNDLFGASYGHAWAPRVGISYVVGRPDVSIKTRASYGKAIKPPFFFQAVGDPSLNAIPNPLLGPEAQQGFDAGAEVYFRDRVSLEATYYGQTAIDLIDYVIVDPTTSPPTRQYQNVGRVKNHGLELAGKLTLLEPLSINATFSIMSSHVETLSPTYRGDLRPGDRLLGVPTRAGGVTLAYRGPRRSVSLSATYVGPQTNLDYVALFAAFYGGQPYRGSRRAYWTTYPSFAKSSLRDSQDITDRVSALLSIDNLANSYANERDNITPPAGRLTLIGVRVH